LHFAHIADTKQRVTKPRPITKILLQVGRDVQTSPVCIALLWQFHTYIMAIGLERRKQLFNKFSNQLLLLKQHGIIDTHFSSARPDLCPICLMEFTDTDLQNNSSNFLTLEDAPPHSLGGGKIALTCKRCNSGCGHNIDNHLTEIIRAIDASYFYKGSQRFGTITHEGEKLTVELTSQGDGTLKEYHRIKHNNPTLLDNEFIGCYRNLF
jgi:hypothetical protein